MTKHMPSIVAELPPDRWLYCLICSQKWPCPDAPIVEYIKATLGATVVSEYRTITGTNGADGPCLICRSWHERYGENGSTHCPSCSNL